MGEEGVDEVEEVTVEMDERQDLVRRVLGFVGVDGDVDGDGAEEEERCRVWEKECGRLDEEEVVVECEAPILGVVLWFVVLCCVKSRP